MYPSTVRPISRRDRQAMTVCIAALCEHEDEPAIVLCSDWQGTYADFVKSDSEFKIRPAGNATILIAGLSHDAEELVAHVRPILKAYDDVKKNEEDFDLRITKLLHDLRKSVRDRRNEIVTHHLFLNYNVDFEQFIRDGAKAFSPDYYARIVSEIRNIRLGCGLIIGCVEDTEPFLIEINDEGKVMWQGDYVCIGTGGLLAWAMMSHTSPSRFTPLIDCMANVLFAKRVAEKDPYVGEATTMMIDIRGKRKTFISDAGQKYLDKHVKGIGRLPELQFDNSYLDQVEDEDEKKEPKDKDAKN